MIQLCLKEYLRFHRYLDTTYMFTKVQNINMEFANVRVKRNWCTPYLISRKLAVPSSGMHFSQHIVHQRQVFEIIDPFLIQPIILLENLPWLWWRPVLFILPCTIAKVPSNDKYLQLCGRRIMIAHSKSRARKQEC